MSTSSEKIQFSILSESETKKFLKKYDKIISAECRKISYLPGIDIDDLRQECRIRLLTGLHKFFPGKAQEKTWVTTVIRRTLYSIREHSIKSIRSCHIQSEDGTEIPAYNYSIHYMSPVISNDEQLSFEDTYTDSPDGRPVFASKPQNPEEIMFITQIIENLKKKLSPEAFEYLKTKISIEESKLISDIEEMENNVANSLIKEGLIPSPKKKEFEIWSTIKKINTKEINLLKQIAQTLINELGFKREEIINRKDFSGIVLKNS